MNLTDQAMQTLAQLLSGLFEDSFVVIPMEKEQPQIARMGLGEDPPEWLSIAEAFELLKRKYKKVSEVCGRADLFIYLVNAGVEVKCE